MNNATIEKKYGFATAKAFARIHALRLHQRHEALHVASVLVANRRRRMLRGTALASPIGGRILHFIELQPGFPGTGGQPGGRGGSEIRAHTSPE